MEIARFVGHRRDDGCFGAFLNPFPNPMRCVPLFTRGLKIALQNLVDPLSHRPQLRTAARRSLAFWRNRARQRLLHHPPVRLQLLRHALDLPAPNRYSRRISSNSSTLRLLSIGSPRRYPRQVRPSWFSRIGQIRVAKSRAQWLQSALSCTVRAHPENKWEANSASLLQSKRMVDVAGIEPATPCLQSTRVPSHDSIPYFGFQRFQQLGESAFRSKLTPMQ